MKLFLKIIGAIVAVLILVFFVFATYFYFNPEPEKILSPEQMEIQKILDALEVKVGDITIESIDQITTIIVPLARQLITKTYPVLSAKPIGSVHVLEEDAFTLKVTEEFVNRNLTEEESLQMAVVVNRLGGIAFCPSADVYLKYPGGGFYTLYYLETAIHELLHALTCENKINTAFPAVWEETFTEYFTLRVLSKYIGMNTDVISSAPERLDIIKRLQKFITEEELFRIYMTKDNLSLEKYIDTTLGRGTYDKLNANMEIVFRQSDYTYIENGSTSNPRVDEALRSIDDLMGL